MLGVTFTGSKFVLSCQVPGHHTPHGPQEAPPLTSTHACRERDGIPAHLLALLDATVEIPQLGVIRSLNVHVSGAIAAYSYSEQWGLRA